MSNVFIMDYRGNKEEIDINIEDVLVMDVIVKTGDEILNVLYKDGHRERYDSSNCRGRDFYDGEYEVINRLCGTDELDSWLSRKSVYGYLYNEDEDEDFEGIDGPEDLVEERG